MLPKLDNFYHPYTKPTLGFYDYDEWATENQTFLILEEIDLYYQPVEEPIPGMIFLFLNILLTILGEIIQIKLFQMVKKENGLVKEVTQIYSMTSIITYPFWCLIISGTDLIHPLHKVIGKWFCTFSWTVTFFSFNLFTFQSCIVASMRYIFIVHEDKVKNYGKERAKRIFAVLTILLPCIMVIWTTIENSELDPFLYINRCYGEDHKVFLREASSLQILKLHFVDFGVTGNENDFYTKIVSIMKLLSGIAKLLISLLMGFNITEGIIYYKIFSHIKR